MSDDEQPDRPVLDYETPKPKEVDSSSVTRGFSNLLFAAGVLAMIEAAFQRNTSARVDCFIASFGLIAFGLVIRMPHFDLLRGYRRR